MTLILKQDLFKRQSSDFWRITRKEPCPTLMNVVCFIRQCRTKHQKWLGINVKMEMFVKRESPFCLKPLVLRKIRKSRCFKKVNIKNSAASLHGNKEILDDILNILLNGLNKQMKQGKRKILLLSFSKVKGNFLPHNITLHLKPLDQGVIQAVKLHYRKFLLQAIISKAEEWKSAKFLPV